MGDLIKRRVLNKSDLEIIAKRNYWSDCDLNISSKEAYTKGIERAYEMFVKSQPSIIKAPHGRLIDVDKMIKRIKMWENHPNKYISERNKDMIYFLNNEEVILKSED